MLEPVQERPERDLEVARLGEELARWVSDYALEWSEPLQLRVVAARYGWRVAKLGMPFRVFMDGLAKAGRIRLVLARGGATHVWPPLEVLKPSGVYSNGKRPE